MPTISHITRMSLTAIYSDGVVITHTADEPKLARVWVSASLGTGPVNDFAATTPAPVVGPVEASFEAAPERPLVIEIRSGGRPEGGMVALSRTDLEAVYEYARHFDVDSDPSMKRVREALGLSAL